MVDLTPAVAHQTLRRSKRRDQVSIPEPYEDIASVYRTVLQLKELVEMLAGQRGAPNDAAVTWQDLLDLQMINEHDVPKDIGTAGTRVR